MDQFHSRRSGRNGSSGIGNFLIEICPNQIGTYCSSNLNSLSKVLNHTLIITLISNFFFFFHCWTRSYHNTNIDTVLLSSMGYNVTFISILLLLQTMIVLIIINNGNNKMGFISICSNCTPTDYMIGITVGICIGGTIVAYMLSRSFRHEMDQCYTTSNTIFTNTTTNTVITHATNSDHTNTTTTNDNNHTRSMIQTNNEASLYDHDPVLQYLCSKTFQRIIKSRMFWSLWIFRLNIINCVLLAIGRPELSTDNQPQFQYSGVSSIDPTSGSNGLQPQQSNHQQQQQPYNNSNNMNAASNNMLPRVPAFSGDYSTVPEVRAVSGDNAIDATTRNSNGHNSIGNYQNENSNGNNNASTAIPVSPSKNLSEYLQKETERKKKRLFYLNHNNNDSPHYVLPASSSSNGKSEVAHILSV